MLQMSEQGFLSAYKRLMPSRCSLKVLQRCAGAAGNAPSPLMTPLVLFFLYPLGISMWVRARGLVPFHLHVGQVLAWTHCAFVFMCLDPFKGPCQPKHLPPVFLQAFPRAEMSSKRVPLSGREGHIFSCANGFKSLPGRIAHSFSCAWTPSKTPVNPQPNSHMNMWTRVLSLRFCFPGGIPLPFCGATVPTALPNSAPAEASASGRDVRPERSN
jgi:hypothetical protein